MGEIQRQAIKGTIFNYLGIVLGFLYVGILFPKLLTTEQIGLLSVLVAYATIATQFSSLGFNAVTTRLFPYFRNKKKKHNGFMMIGISVQTAGFILGAVILLVLQHFHLLNRERNPVFDQYFCLIFWLFFAMLFFNFFDNYFKVLYNAVVGTALKEFSQRLFIFVSVFFIYFHIVDFGDFTLLYAMAFTLPLIIIILLLIRRKEFFLSFPEKPVSQDLKKEMKTVALFSIISGFAGILTLNIDRIMIQSFDGLSDTGIYTTMFFFGTLVSIPARSLIKISSAYVADAWKENNLKLIDTILRKSVLNQSIIGILILVGLWVNINNVLAILKPAFLPGKYVVLVIGGAYLIDMFTGVSNIVLGTSKYFKYGTCFIILQSVFIIVFNLIFIPIYGILGAAIGSLIAKLLFNFLKMGFLYKKLHFFPYSGKILLPVLVGGIAYLSAYFMPSATDPYLDAVLKGAVVTVIFIGTLYLLKTSEEINGKINQILRFSGKLKQ